LLGAPVDHLGCVRERSGTAGGTVRRIESNRLTSERAPRASRRTSGAGTLRAALDAHRGWVTTFLEAATGEPIVATVLDQRTSSTGRAPALSPIGAERVLLRSAVLAGARTGTPFVYAKSQIVIDRLPSSVIARLDVGEQPIGRILDDHGLDASIRPLGAPDRPSPPRHLALLRTLDVVMARRYLMSLEGVATMEISEWFLSSLTQPLPHDAA
jgi:chorismate-pyruvate lyase